MARLKTLVKCFMWEERNRDDIVLGPNTRLNPSTHRAQLLADADGNYPTDADLYVKSKLTTPLAVRNWIGFEAKIIHYGDPDNPSSQVTDAKFRLDDGTDERYWDGAAWVVAGVSDWNTEQEIADNISSWSVVTFGRSMRVIVNLSTTDERLTPELIAVLLAYEAKIEFQEDIIYRSLVPALRNINPIGRTTFTAQATTNIFNLEQTIIDTPYNFVDVDSVYDHTNDPDHLNDLFLSYDSGTKDITLTGNIAAGDRVWIDFVYQPVVSVSTDQDYIDGRRVPEVVITETSFNGRETTYNSSVVNKGSKTAIVVPPPVQGDMLFTVEVVADKELDKQRLIEQLNRYLYNNAIIASSGIDEPYRIQMLQEFEDKTVIDQKNLKTAEATFVIKNFLVWNKDAYTEYIATGATPGALPGSTIGINQRGSVIDGLGGWTWAYDGLGFTQNSPIRWFGMNLYGKNYAKLFGEGGFVENVSTDLLASRGIGVLRLNRGIKATDTSAGLFQDRDLDNSVPHNFPNPGSDDLHFRLLVKDPFNQSGAGVVENVYLDMQDIGGSRVKISSMPGTTKMRFQYGSYVEDVDVGSNSINSWALIDFMVSPTDPTTQVTLFVNGGDFTPVLTQPGSLVSDAFTSNPALALFNSINPSATTAALNVSLLFVGIAVGRSITLTRHKSDSALANITTALSFLFGEVIGTSSLTGAAAHFADISGDVTGDATVAGDLYLHPTGTPRSLNGDGAGSLDEVDGGNITFLDNQTEATFAFWWNPDSVSLTSREVFGQFIQADDTTTDGVFRFLTSSTAGVRCQVYLYNTATTAASFRFDLLWATGWHHYIFRIDTVAQSFNCYKDGAFFGNATYQSGTWPSAFRPSSSNFRVLRANPSVSNNEADGRFRSFAIWDKLLSVGEISDVYNSGDSSIDLNTLSSAPNLKYWLYVDTNDTLADVINYGSTRGTAQCINMEAADISSDIP